MHSDKSTYTRLSLYVPEPFRPIIEEAEKLAAENDMSLSRWVMYAILARNDAHRKVEHER